MGNCQGRRQAYDIGGWNGEWRLFTFVQPYRAESWPKQGVKDSNWHKGKPIKPFCTIDAVDGCSVFPNCAVATFENL